MADVELLPLPELPRQVEGYSGDYWEAGQVEEYATDYARACVEANIAPLQAENEQLRAEVELWRHKAAVHQYRRERLAEALRWAERHCPCGARPESPDTHPHMPGCLVGAALAQEDRND